MKNPLHGRHPMVQLTVLTVVLPLLIGLAVLGFAWPAGRLAPRNLATGVVGPTPLTGSVMTHLDAAEPGAFSFHRYSTTAAAEAAIRTRDVYGAVGVSPAGVTVYEAGAASPAVAQVLDTVGQRVALMLPGATATATASVVDVVPEPAGDSRGVVFSASLLPLTICSLLLAAALGMAVRARPAWRHITGLLVLAAVSGATAYVVAQGFLGALPGDHWATWAALSLTILAIAATTAGLIALIGPAGLGIGAVLFVFLGNPFSGATSAPNLLPAGVDHLGQWLPPGAGSNLIRSTAYFADNGSQAHLLVLFAWIAAGLTAIVAGHHTSPRFAARQS